MKQLLRLTLAVAFLVLTAHSTTTRYQFQFPVAEMSGRAFFMTYGIDPGRPVEPDDSIPLWCLTNPLLCNCGREGCGY